MRSIAVFLLLTILLSFSCQSKTIDWLVVDFAPYYIFNDRLEGTGRDESVIKLLEKTMSEYKFSTTFVPASRAINELSNPLKNYCMLSLYKNKQRKKHILFSEEFSTIGLSPSIAIHKELAKQLNLDKTQLVSLNSLLSKHKLTLGIPMNRSYGNAIDAVIDNNQNLSIITRPGRDTLVSLTYMLNKRRIDMVLGYPSEHYYLAKSMNLEEALIQLPLLEAPDVSFGYIGCSNNEQGAAQISALNLALKKLKKMPEYDEVMLSWLPDNLHPLLQAQINQQHKKATQ